jgi:HK97 family phage portal protein
MNNFLYHALAAVGAIRSYPAPQPVTWETVFGSGRHNLSGVSVTEYSSLRHSPVWCGVTTLAADVARVPLSLYKVLPNGGKIPFKTHRLYRILHDDANPEMTSYKFRETMQALCLLFGNAYAEIVRTELGDVAGLYPILPSRVVPFREERGGRLRYRVSNPNGGQSVVAPENILHLSSVSFDGIIGESMVSHASESIGLGMAAEKFGAAFFGNGATFGGVASYDQKLDPAQRADIQTAIEAIHQGVDRAHKILVLGMGAKFTERGTKPSDAQMTELRDFQVREVARWLKMPPHKLQDYKDAHFTNVEHSEISYWVGCVGSWFKMWEQELTRKCVKPLEYGQQAIGFNMNAQMRGDSQARGEFYSKMFGIGALSVNDILQLEDMNPIGPSGDLHLVPLNMVPLERYNEMIDAQIEAKKPKEIAAPKPEPAVDEETQRKLVQAIEERDAAVAEARAHQERVREKETEIAAQAGTLEAVRAAAAEQAERANVAGAGRDVAVLEAEEARHAVVAHQAMLEQRQAELAALEAARVALETRAAAAEQATRDASEQAAARARAASAAADARIEQEAARAAEAEAARLSSVEQETTLRQAHEAATRDLAAATARESELSEARAREAEEARAAVAAAEARIAQEAAKVAEAETARLLAVDQEVTLRQAHDTVTRDVAAFTTRATELETDLQKRKDAELDRLTRVVAAHRGLIVHAVQRLLRPEVDRARRRQATPEQLRKWVDAFYVTHRDVCADEFYPAVMTHLAWKRSDEDPRTVARAMAEAHCAQSERELLAVLDGTDDPQDLHVALERVLGRWEQDRPQTAADGLLHDELTYIATFQ